MKQTSEIKKASQLRDSDKRILLAYSNIPAESAPKPVVESTVSKQAYRIV